MAMVPLHQHGAGATRRARRTRRRESGVRRRARSGSTGPVQSPQAEGCSVWSTDCRARESDGWSAPLTVVMLAASAVLIGAFLVVEMRVPGAAVAPSDRRRSQPRRGLPDDCRHVLRDVRRVPLPHLLHAARSALQPTRHRCGVPPDGCRYRAGRRFGEHRVDAPRRATATSSRPAWCVAAAGMAWLGRLGVDATVHRRYPRPDRRTRCRYGDGVFPARWISQRAGSPPGMPASPRQWSTPASRSAERSARPPSTIFTTALARYIEHHQPPTPACRGCRGIDGYTVAFHIAGALFLAGAILTALILRSGRLQIEADSCLNIFLAITSSCRY